MSLIDVIRDLAGFGHLKPVIPAEQPFVTASGVATQNTDVDVLTSVEIIEVELTDRKLLDRFLKMPWYIYRQHHPMPNWVPPLLMAQRDFLKPANNPFFEHANCHFWIARQHNRDVGRIAAVVDADWEKTTGEKTGYFGFFESTDDSLVANALLDTAFQWLKRQGMVDVIGPMNLSTNHQSGLLIDGFDTLPCIEMAFNPPYYDGLLKSYGMEKTKDLLQWRASATGPVPARMEKLAQRLKKRGRIQLRKMQLKNWDAEVGRLLEIYNDAWVDLWGFVPLSEKELRYLAGDMKMVIEPALAIIAEIEGQPVGVTITIRNINPLLHKINGRLFPTGLIRLLWGIKTGRGVNSGRVIIAGVKNSCQHMGIGSIMYMETRNAIAKLGWDNTYIGWTLEDNDDVNSSIRSFDGEIDKTFRIYRKAC